MSVWEKVWEVEWGVGKLLRFVFGGVAAALVSYLYNPTWTVSIYDGLGMFICAILLAEIGIVFYLSYHALIGDVFVFRLAAKPSTDWLARLKIDGVSIERQKLFLALRAIKRSDLYRTKAREVDIAHSELHMLYMSCVVILTCAGLWGARDGMNVRFWVLVGIAIVLFVATFRSDRNQHRYEVHILDDLNKHGELSRFLKHTGFLANSSD